MSKQRTGDKLGIILLVAVFTLLFVSSGRGEPHATADSAIIQIPTTTPITQIHVVQPGETLNRIAAAYDVPLQELAQLNQITNSNLVYTGQRLLIPLDIAPVNVVELGPPTATPTIGPTPLPTPLTARIITVNELSVESFIIMPPNVRAHVREIYALGQELGRNPNAFSKLGDSTIANPLFLGGFETEPYNLGNYTYLQSVLDYYAGSFNRDSYAVRVGLHSWSVLDPMWAVCPSGHMLACEFARHNPSILFIRMGSNDKGISTLFESSMREIVEYCLENGVVPILGTKADRFDGSDNINNNIIRQIAADYEVPLWDFDLVAATLPDRGLSYDLVHMTGFPAHDWRLPEAFTSGHGVHNLTGLMALHAVWRTIQTGT